MDLIDSGKIYDKIFDAYLNDGQILKPQLEKIFDLLKNLLIFSQKEEVTVYLKDEANKLEIVIGRQPSRIGEGDSAKGISIKFNGAAELEVLPPVERLGIFGNIDKDLE
jgi:hypothetical protein